MGAAGESTDAVNDELSVQEELVADNRVRREDSEATTCVNLGGMRVGGVGRADELSPMVADGLLDRGAAHLVFYQQVFDQPGHRACRTAAHAARRFVGDSAKIRDEPFSHAGEM